MNIKTLTLGDDNFPVALAAIPQPPEQLFVLGDTFQELLTLPMISIVGSRKVSSYGRMVTTRIAEELARQGIVIVSGLALGVDSIAHQAALEVGGRTIAVLPAGLDTIVPISHVQLARTIVAGGGALITEYPADTPPMRHNFIARNRLVSGISLAVVITEAAEKSGTLHTANFALEQGKAVFAVPGNITSQLSKGTNNLIKAGAHPVTETADILSVLGLSSTMNKEGVLAAASVEEAAILRHLQSGVTDASELQLLSKLPPSTFNQTLTMLEITGRIKSLGAGHWSLS